MAQATNDYSISRLSRLFAVRFFRQCCVAVSVYANVASVQSGEA
jgi:hypothetical protein